jgi:hypothetical protein
MKYIVKYEIFNESKGISDSCEKTLNKIWKDIELNIKNTKSFQSNFNIDESDFKCKNIVLKFTINKGDENKCNARALLNDSKIENEYLNNLNIDVNITHQEIDDEFLFYIKSVLFHELLHIFQHYNIIINSKFRPESFSIGSILPQLRNVVRTNYGKYILDILYHSLSHEISAQIHQYYLYKNDNREYKKIFDIKQLLGSFKIVDITPDEENDVKFIKKHISGSIKHFTTNSNYLKDINRSIWNESDINKFLKKLKNLLDSKVEWIEKKIKLIDNKIEQSRIIKYDENITLPHDWELYDIYNIYNFIKENLNDAKNEDFI